MRDASIVAVLLALFVALALVHAAGTSPTYDEPAHIASGYTAARFGDYRINPEHPPLLKRVAALGLLGLEPFPPDLELGSSEPISGRGSTTWKRARRAWEMALDTGDAQWVFSHSLLYGLTDEALARLGASESYTVDPVDPPRPGDYLNDASQLMWRARLPMILLGTLLGGAIWRFTRTLYGMKASWLALSLFALDPNFIAHSSLVTTDVGLALLLFGAVSCLWAGFHRPGRLWLPAAAMLTALAFAAKFSAVLIVPILVPLILFAPLGVESALVSSPLDSRRSRLRRIKLLLAGCAAIGLLTWGTIWAFYGFRYAADAGTPPRALPIENVLRQAEAIEAMRREYPQTSPPRDALQAAITAAPLDGIEGLVLLAADRHLLPESYLHGFAHARMKSLARRSFLRGRHYLHGVWSYFPWAFLIKTPLGTLALLAIAIALLVSGQGPWRSEALFLFVPVLVWLAFSLPSALNIGHRHLLPIYPFLYVFIGGLAARLDARRTLAVVAAVVVSSTFVFTPPWNPVSVHPGPLSFFNEIAGGPSGGYRYLVDSNLDWGQDLPALARWLEEHEVNEPIYLCYFGMADPRYYGIRHIKAPGGYDLEPPFRGRATFPQPGREAWIAISATNLQGAYFPPELRHSWSELLSSAHYVGTAGRSLFIYRIESSGS
jgi:Dolichyl-phosphate-mannose-protein mannosyltransferase